MPQFWNTTDHPLRVDVLNPFSWHSLLLSSLFVIERPSKMLKHVTIKIFE